VDRISLFETIEIEPRPVCAGEEIHPRPITLAPTPAKPLPDPAAEIAQAVITSHAVAPVTLDGPAEVGHSESDVLLRAIRIVAKKEPTFVNERALRDLIRRFAHQYSLDF
jgi:hypothetical protein